MKKVSIVIPTKNRRDLLIETLASVRAQTYACWEAIVVDDGSSDGTLEMLRELSLQDARIRGLARTREPAGAPSCRNIGLKASEGEYIIFLDSDDVLAPECVEHRLERLENSDLEAVVSSAWTFDDNPRHVTGYFGGGDGRTDLIRFLCMRGIWQTTGPMYRRSTVERIGYWDEELVIGQDLDYLARSMACGMKYDWMRTADYGYRCSTRNETLGSGLDSPERTESHHRRIMRMCGLFQGEANQNAKVRNALAGNLLWVAQKWAVAGFDDRAYSAWEHARDRELVDTHQYRLGRLLLWSIRAKASTAVAYLAAKFMPRGMLLSPDWSPYQEGECDAVSGEYIAPHSPLALVGTPLETNPNVVGLIRLLGSRGARRLCG